MEYIIGGVIGSVCATIISCIFSYIRRPMLGVLKIDESDPNNVKWRFVITKDIDLSKMNRIYLKVDSHADLSQK